MVVFQSIYHPGGSSLAYVLAHAQATPVAFALVAVLIGTFASLMQGAAVFPTLFWLVPLAYAAATAWSIYELHRKPAEIVLSGGFGTVRSVWDVARGANLVDEPLYRVFPGSRVDGELTVSIGHDVCTIRPEEWREFSKLKNALAEASLSFASSSGLV